MSSQIANIMIPEQFEDIAPYRGQQFVDAMARLVEDPGFEHAVRYVMPDVDYPEFVKGLKLINDQHEFQVNVMGPFLELLAKSTTSGLSIDGTENCSPGVNYTFISNHRDIVLDPSFLNLCFIRNGLPLTQVAIGNNLLIYDWIADLVKVNRSFIVKRDVGMAKTLEAAKQLSGYIHYTINTLKESVWIAQRQGRAKDSNDLTQEALVKMLALGGGGCDVMANLKEINLMPVAISYEFDPNDYLKAREFLLRRRDPDFKKTKRDDLFSMETGLLRYKGRVHFRLGRCINADLEAGHPEDRAEIIRKACVLIDRAIHCGYRIYPCNYIAYDEINGTADSSAHYTSEDVREFDEYLNRQLDKVEVENVTTDERNYMRRMMLSMYANPLRNQLAAEACVKR